MTAVDRPARAVLILATLLLAAGLAACGSSTGARHDDADVAFATAMIPHHTQGIVAAKLAATHASSPKIKRLASQIVAEQDPEVFQMQALLTTWAEPPASTTGMAGMPGMASMPGMLTDQQMTQLGGATGPAFDRLFLQLMIVHDQGGAEMARTEMSGGRDSDATILAQNIDDAQEYAIPVLQQLLAQP